MNKILVASLFAVASTLSAAVIVSPVNGVINSGGPGFGSLADTFNHNGLSAGYTSGVTDFDAYLAGNPTHTVAFGGFEWFSNEGTTSARVTYDLGSLMSIDRLALWNEESSGIGTLNLLYSTDNSTFNPLVSNLHPTDHPLADYTADVFGFGGSVNARWVRFDMSGCPQPNVGSFQACAIGEVAFSSGASTGVPEPSSVLLIGLGLSGLIAARFRKS